MRGTELILFVRAQNQASATLRRIASDVRGLTHARDLQGRAEDLSIRQGRRQLVLEGRQRELTKLRGIETANMMRGQLRDLAQMRQAQEQFIRSRPRNAAGQFINLDPFKRQLQATKQAQDALSSAYHAQERELDRLPPRLQRLRYFHDELATAVDKTRRSIGLQERELAQGRGIETQIRQMQRLQRAEAMQMRGRTASHAGRALQFGGLIGTAALGAAANQAAQFSTSATQAATQARDITASFDQVAGRTEQIQNQILQLMQQFPAAQEEMSQSAYDIFSSINLIGVGFDENGQKVAKGVTNMRAGFDLMARANQVAVAGNEDLATATSALITVINNFDPNLENVNEQLDTMFDIIRFGRMRLSEFDTMMNRIAPAAKGAGQSLEDVGGAMAFLTERIPSQSQVATGIARLLQAFQHPDFVKGMETLGAPITVGEGAEKKLMPLVDIMETIVARFPELKQGGVEAENFFRRITQAGRLARTGRPGQGNIFTEFGRRAFRLMSTDMDGLIERQEQIEDNQDEFNNALQAMLQSQGVQWRIFLNQLRAAVIIIGREAIPHFVALGKHIQSGVKWFRNLSEGTQSTIVKFAALLAIGSLIGGVLLSIGGGALALVGTLRILAGTPGQGLGRTVTMMGTTITVGSRLLGILKLLGAIGVISIVIKTLWTGDATAKDFLLGALAGAAAGFAVGGPLGALVGGIAVPITLKVIDELKEPARLTNDMRRNGERARQAWEQGLAQGGQGARDQLRQGIDAFESDWRAGIANLKLPHNLLIPQTEAAWRTHANQALEAGKITQQQYLKGMALAGFSGSEVSRQTSAFFQANSEMADKLFRLRRRGGGKQSPMDQLLEGVEKAKADEIKKIVNETTSELEKLGVQYDKLNQQTGGAGPKMGLEAFIRSAREVERLRKVAEKAPTWANWKAFHTAQERLTKNSTQTQQTIWQDYARAVQQATDDIKRYNEGMVDAVAQATEQANNEIEQAAQRLTQLYQSIRSEHEQAFGQLFSGPWLDSEFGQTAEEWGITPDIGDLTKDLNQQLGKFNQFNNALRAIARRGAPKELVAELKALGPDALDKIDVLRRAAPGKFNQFVNVWRNKQQAIEDATKIDFDKQLTQWFSYGANIARNIILGLQSENVALDAAFKKYITDKFPNFINDAVAQARTEYRQEQGPRPTRPRLPGSATRTGTTTIDASTNVTVAPTKGENSTDAARRAVYLTKSQARLRQQQLETALRWDIPGRRGGR